MLVHLDVIEEKKNMGNLGWCFWGGFTPMFLGEKCGGVYKENSRQYIITRKLVDMWEWFYYLFLLN